MLKLRHALLASLCLLPLAATDALAATAGVTAAVNQSAKSTPPGGAVRTVVLGANIVQDETIETDGAGLVQILLADGTTFTVGPNSAITIDRFVYDPDANTAQVSATIGRGVFRFIGGRTSKTEGGVQLNTPVGTVGIRGGMADLNFTGAGQIDLLFGNEVTLNGPNGSNRIFQPGYSIVFGANGQPTVIKTPPGSANFIQQALAGRPGTSGGSSQKPTDGKVANSGVPGSNSGSNPPGQQIPPPDLRAIDLATPKPNDNHQVAENVLGPRRLSGTFQGYSAAIVRRGGTNSFYRNIYPSTDPDDDGGEVTLSFDAVKREFSGVIVVNDTGDEGTLNVAFGPSHGGTSYYYNDLLYYADGGPAKLDGHAVDGGASTYVVSIGVGSAISDCECEFAQIGYWYSEFVDDNEGDVEATGTFVVGKITTAAEYDALVDNNVHYGIAHYSGIAIGYLTKGGFTSPAAGSLDMNYNLGTRSGSMSVSDFGSVGVGFTADLNGTGASFSGLHVGTGDTSYDVAGSFITDGSNPVAGVIGNFDASDTTAIDPDEHWSATGVFAGAQTGLTPSNY